MGTTGQGTWVRSVAVVLGFSFLWFANVHATEFTVQDGYSLEEILNNAGGGFDYLPDGDAVIIDTAQPASIFLLDANGDGEPSAPQVIGGLPSGSFASFIKVSPDGSFAVYGMTGSSNAVKKIDLTNYSVTEIVDVDGNHDLVFLSTDEVLISRNSSFDPSVPNEVVHLDLNNPIPEPIVSINDTPSGPVAVNSAGDLYFIKGTWTFPPPLGSHRLLKWTSEQIESAIVSGIPLEETDSQISISMDGGYNLAINAFNDLFVSYLSGQLVRVDEGSGTTSVLAETPGSFTHVAFYNTNNFFNPYEQSSSGLGAAFADVTFINQSIVQITPTVDDSFADSVLSFLPGAGGSGDVALALGPPVGGGTENPDNSSIILLGDRDNPTIAEPATLTLEHFFPIHDDAQNLYGSDVIVFGNSFWITNDPQNRFVEPAMVEVSQDLNHNGIADDQWFLIEPNILPDDLGPTDPVEYYTMTLRNYAEFSPTLILGDIDGDNIVDIQDMDPENFYTVPDRQSFEGDEGSYSVDANSGGGDAGDLRAALVTTSPGVPLVDSFGKKRFVYLDRADFVRLQDARNGDLHAGLGLVAADIDAVADAKPRLRGTTLTVTNVQELEDALASAVAGDEIVLQPGTYLLNTTITVPLGVSVVGSSGLWTVNDSSDDTVIDGSQLPFSALAAIVLSDPTGTFTSDQGYEISGLHFVNCRTAIQVDRMYPTIQQNVFQGTLTSLAVRNASAEHVVVRSNVFDAQGPTEFVTADVTFAARATGIQSINSTLAMIHNVFVNHGGAAVFLGSNTEAYVRDNIFHTNRVGIAASASPYVYGHYNVFYANRRKYVIGTGLMENDILADPTFANPSVRDYRLAVDSPVRGQGMGGADPGVYDGPNFIPYDLQ